MDLIQQKKFRPFDHRVLREGFIQLKRESFILGEKIETLGIELGNAPLDKDGGNAVILFKVMEDLADLLLRLIVTVRGLNMENSGTLAEMKVFDLAKRLRHFDAHRGTERGLVRERDFLPADRHGGRGVRNAGRPDCGGNKSNEGNDGCKGLTSLREGS